MKAAHLLLPLLFIVPVAALAQAPDPPALIPEDTPAAEPQTPVEEPPPSEAPAPPPASHVQPVAAVVPAATEDNWYDDIAFHAFVSTAYMHNFATNSAATPNVGRLFDRFNDTFTVDGAQLTFSNEPTKPGEAGFRTDIVYGLTIPASIGNGIAALQQGFVSYIVPFGSGLRVDVGTFMSHVGSEVIETHENINDSYSRSLLFLAAPALLTGARLGYSFSDGFRLNVLAVNGWSPNVIDNNLAKTVGAQLLFTPVSAFTLSIHYIGGAELDNDSNDWRHLIDAVAILKTQALALTVEGMFGRQINADGSNDSWAGVLGSLRWDATDFFDLTLRAEYFNNSDPAPLPLVSLGAQVVEVTFTPALKFSETAVLRFEVRYDRAVSGGAIFPADKGQQNTYQTTLAANFLFIF